MEVGVQPQVELPVAMGGIADNGELQAWATNMGTPTKSHSRKMSAPPETSPKGEKDIMTGTLDLFGMGNIAQVQMHHTPGKVQYENLNNQMTNLALVSALFCTMLFSADFLRPWGDDVDTYHEKNVRPLSCDWHTKWCYGEGTCLVNFICTLECVGLLLRLSEVPRGAMNKFITEYRYDRIMLVYQWSCVGMWGFLLTIQLTLSVSCSPWVTISFASLIVLYMVYYYWNFYIVSAPARDAAIKYWLAETEPQDSLLQAFMAQGHWSKASAESLCRQLSDAGLDDIEDMPNYTEANWAAWFGQVVSGYICFKDAVKIQRVLQQQALHSQSGKKLQEGD